MSEQYLNKADSLPGTIKGNPTTLKNIKNGLELSRSGMYLSQERYEDAQVQCEKLKKLDLKPEERKLLEMNYAHLFEYLGEPAIAEEY